MPDLGFIQCKRNYNFNAVDICMKQFKKFICFNIKEESNGKRTDWSSWNGRNG